MHVISGKKDRKGNYYLSVNKAKQVTLGETIDSMAMMMKVKGQITNSWYPGSGEEGAGKCA